VSLPRKQNPIKKNLVDKIHKKFKFNVNHSIVCKLLKEKDKNLSNLHLYFSIKGPIFAKFFFADSPNFARVCLECDYTHLNHNSLMSQKKVVIRSGFIKGVSFGGSIPTWLFHKLKNGNSVPNVSKLCNEHII
jgi:hypothetical protein